MAVSTSLLALLALIQILIDYAKSLPAPSRKRQQIVDPLRGEARTVELLLGPPQAIKTLTRLNQELFVLLLDRLVNEYSLSRQEGVLAAQKLIIFIAICRGRLSQRLVA